MKKIKIPNIKKADNLGNVPRGWDGEQCLFCSRFLGASRFWVHMTTDLFLVDVATPEESVDRSQGWHPVGSYCARKIDKAFRLRSLPWQEGV